MGVTPHPLAGPRVQFADTGPAKIGIGQLVQRTVIALVQQFARADVSSHIHQPQRLLGIPRMVTALRWRLPLRDCAGHLMHAEMDV